MRLDNEAAALSEPSIGLRAAVCSAPLMVFRFTDTCEDLLGDVPAESAWGRFYAAKCDAGHLIFRLARFYSIGELVRVVGETGFTVTAATSTLETPPESTPLPEAFRSGIDEALASFVCSRGGARRV